MLKKFLYILYLIFTTIILGEILFLIFPAISEKHPPYNTAEIDKKLGWLPKSNYLFEGEMASLDGQTYPVRMTTNENGFRNTGNGKKSENGIFIIGDSFTQAVEVSDDKTYFAHLENSLNKTVHAFGMSGYGTLQEMLILEKYIDKIDPSTVIIQFCSNDFIDNEIELERNAIYHVGLRRPYIDTEGNITYQTPLKGLNRLIAKTNFLKFCSEKFNRIKQKAGIKKRNSSEEKIGELRQEFPAYKSSLDKTNYLLQRIKSIVGPDRNLLLFCADTFEPQQNDIKSICEKTGIPFLMFPKEQMESTRNTQEVYTQDGFHWNETGHKIIGNVLEQKLIEFNLKKAAVSND